MAFNTPSNIKFRSNIDKRYDAIKKLMNELDDMSNNFNSVIIAQDKISKNNITSLSSNQNNTIINKSISIIINETKWGFIKDKDLHYEKEKLIKHFTK